MPTLPQKEDLQSQHGFLFVHIPKTAGRSILNALGAHFHCQHLRLVDYEKQIGAEELAKRFKFAVIRNPWDRAASWYRFFQHRPHLPTQEQSFDEWAIKASRNPQSPLDQFRWLRDSSGKIQIDQFLQFENLESDYAKLRSRLGFLPEKIGHIGGNDRIHHAKLPDRYQDYFKSQKAIDAVASCNQELIAKFGYEFGQESTFSI